MPPKQLRDPAFAKAFKDLDKGFASQLTRFSKGIHAACEKVDSRIIKVGYSNVPLQYIFRWIPPYGHCVACCQ